MKVDFALHRNIEYDASDGEDRFRVTGSSEWLSRADFEALMRTVEAGIFSAQVEVKQHGRSKAR